MTLRSSLQRIADLLKKVDSLKGDDSRKAITDFKQKKKQYELSLLSSAIKSLSAVDFSELKQNNDIVLVNEIKENVENLKGLYEKKDLDALKKSVDQLMSLDQKLSYPKSTKEVTFSIRNIPADLADEVHADIKELEKCFSTECFRAAIILCGRLLETALHYKYYKATNNDLLEKSPGIGLGSIIAKLKERNIDLDPGLSQQIHLINQVRIFSVHKKQQVFDPSKDQAHAIMLYTLDSVRKLFSS